ncbi:hypothetical protein GBAR_LOCUS23643 [Geodia barretti]|nr:hypothetical protein GBAR_LOCUS23643 [Geodia barretti]
MSTSGEFSRRVEEGHMRLAEALGLVYAGLAGPSRAAGAGRGREETEAVDVAVTAGSLSSAVSELEGLAESLRSLYEDHVHQLEREHSQYRTDSEGREQSTARLLRELEGENERLADINQSLRSDLKELQSRYRATETSLKEKDREVGGLVEQLGAHQEDQRQAIVGREERVREAAEKAEQLRWRVREEERERGEREKELEASRDMERSLRTALSEVRQQLEMTHQELGKTQQELHSTEATLATTSEDFNILKHQLQPKEEELQALQEKIADRSQQLMELLDRRSGDYSRQVQEEILAQSRAYDDLLRKITDHTPSAPPTSDQPLSPSRPLELAICLRDFLNPHLLPPLPSSSSPSSPLSSPRLPRNDTVTTAYQRYCNTFTDFTQRVRVGEFRACPRSRLRLHRLQQSRHQFMEIILRPAPGLMLDESPLCDVITLMKGVAKKLALAPNSLLVYTVDKTRIRGTALR